MDRDGFIELSVSEDAMIARLSFFPAQGEGRFLTADYLESFLEAQEIVHGVRMEDLTETIFQVNTSGRAREDVVAAEGTPPVAARPAFYRVLYASGNDDSRSRHHSDRVDHKRVSRLPVVRKGQIVARLVPEIPGEPGWTVRGAEIPFSTVPVESLQPGDNTRVKEDTVVALIGGQLQVREGKFHVEDHLEITGDVGYATGSIEFPGDITLKGEVRDGFHIWAGGSIAAAGTVDVSEVYCRKDFIANGGIVGRGRALLRCGGRVRSRFVGNCHVESKLSVFVKQYVYHSEVSCLDRFAMGNRGRIIGGTITAVEGIRCYNLGNAAHAPTTIRVGINFIAERKLRRCQEKQQTVTGKLNKLTKALPENPSHRQLDILHRLEESRNTLIMEMGELAGEIDRHEQAEVIVDGEVHPGVRIQICRSTYLVEEVMKKTRFSLDKNLGLIKAESLTDQTGPPPADPVGEDSSRTRKR